MHNNNRRSWSSWEDNGYCSTSCGNGTQIRRRRCDNPAPTNDGNECPGDNVTSVHCNIKECPGSWSCWEDDGYCSTSCGNGTQIRRRRCDNPAPTNDGNECPGDNVTSVHCNIKECRVYKWGHLKELNLTKDETKEVMKNELDELKSNLTIDSKNMSATIRKRISARDERPSAASVVCRFFYKGAKKDWRPEYEPARNSCYFEECSNACGSGTMTFTCDMCPYSRHILACTGYKGCLGVWGRWTQFSECSTTCDEGQMLFTRKCNHPSLGHLATDCVGDSNTYKPCNLRGCPGSWSCWEEDGYCSTSCGNGTKTRRRRCDNPAPTNDGNECPGDNVTYVHCNMKDCSVYKWGHLKEFNLSKDDLKELMKDELDELKSNLTIDSKNISASIRKRISARDDRPSAASVGYVGVALLLIPLVMIISLDAPQFLALVVNIYRKVCKRRSLQIGNAEQRK
ncbi:hemicentin-1-like [Mytilus trossulus]|uniref:hemicentin-1-like n=1 Tax=Mytilus trossulus TaxID=6551 RepID=UPI00300520C0